ncbi:MAG: hypothetical protein AAF212_07500 [Verrucomicrobiota bacterium]
MQDRLRDLHILVLINWLKLFHFILIQKIERFEIYFENNQNAMVMPMKPPWLAMPPFQNINISAGFSA